MSLQNFVYHSTHFNSRLLPISYEQVKNTISKFLLW